MVIIIRGLPKDNWCRFLPSYGEGIHLKRRVVDLNMDSKTNSHILGESIAKLYFELNGYFTYTNSSGKAEFDILISKDSLVYTVEVKSCSSLKECSKGEYFEVQIGSIRSNTSENTIHRLDMSFIDYLAIVNTLDNTILVLTPKEVGTKGRSIRVYRDQFRALI